MLYFLFNTKYHSIWKIATFWQFDIVDTNCTASVKLQLSTSTRTINTILVLLQFYDKILKSPSHSWIRLGYIYTLNLTFSISYTPRLSSHCRGTRIYYWKYPVFKRANTPIWTFLLCIDIDFRRGTRLLKWKFDHSKDI